MKTPHTYQPATQLLTEFIQKLSGTEKSSDAVAPPSEKSRWTKWKLLDENDVHSVSYCRMEKAESSLLSRLADRLNYWSGNARCAAKNKIIEELTQQGIEITEDIKRALPDRWKLGNTNRLESGIKAVLEKKEQVKAEAEAKQKILKDYCESKLAEPFRLYLWCVVNKDATSAGNPISDESKAIQNTIIENISILLEPQLKIFIDSLLTSLLYEKKLFSNEAINTEVNTRFKKFLLSVFSSSEVEAVINQISSAHEVVGEELKARNRRWKGTDTMPRLNPIMSDKLVEKAIERHTKKILSQSEIEYSPPLSKGISDSLDSNEYKLVFRLMSDTLIRQLDRLETIRFTQKSSGVKN